jgi:RNA polymerase sigma factor (TIGR02999 family)
LVHEAWLRLGGDKQPDWVNRAQFFSAAAEAMRRILVEKARRRKAIRHGGGQKRIDLDAQTEEFGIAGSTAADDILLALHEGLNKLAVSDRLSTELVKLCYFAGLSVEEAAGTLNLSKRTAERRLTFARAWLGMEMDRELHD